MKYLSKEPMVFGPPRRFITPDGKSYGRQMECDHKGKVHIWRGAKWICKECGGEITDDVA